MLKLPQCVRSGQCQCWRYPTPTRRCLKSTKYCLKLRRQIKRRKYLHKLHTEQAKVVTECVLAGGDVLSAVDMRITTPTNQACSKLSPNRKDVSAGAALAKIVASKEFSGEVQHISGMVGTIIIQRVLETLDDMLKRHQDQRQKPGEVDEKVRVTDESAVRVCALLMGFYRETQKHTMTIAAAGVKGQLVSMTDAELAAVAQLPEPGDGAVQPGEDGTDETASEAEIAVIDG